MYYFNTLQATQNGTKVFQEGILLHFITLILICFCFAMKGNMDEIIVALVLRNRFY